MLLRSFYPPATSGGVKLTNVAHPVSSSSLPVFRSPNLPSQPLAPQYWYEKGILWLLPALSACGSTAIQSIILLEAARGFAPIGSANYGSVPLSFYDLPIF